MSSDEPQRIRSQGLKRARERKSIDRIQCSETISLTSVSFQSSHQSSSPLRRSTEQLKAMASKHFLFPAGFDGRLWRPRAVVCGGAVTGGSGEEQRFQLYSDSRLSLERKNDTLITVWHSHTDHRYNQRYSFILTWSYYNQLCNFIHYHAQSHVHWKPNISGETDHILAENYHFPSGLWRFPSTPKQHTAMLSSVY